MAKVFIGTSGYIYSHWENGVFYPENLSKTKKLEYYCQHFKTVELNSTFYRLPSEKTFEGWQKRTPKDFIFSVKVSRFITHVKKLKDCKDSFEIFLKRALILKEKLGPLLFQLPPNFKKDTQRLKEFIEMAQNVSKTLSHKKLRFAFEFRHKSWCQSQVYEILKEKNCAWVVVDSPFWPKVFKITADFVYVRMHGSKILFGSDYTKTELKDLVEKIKEWRKKNLDIFVYFNNDAHGFAPKNAKEILELISKPTF
ncbi:DUF72 domain-containing protein [Candidatus Parcubacteria bacterium]|nr:DUF72 domain-containing protein [Candidatus Parcubacteria bacterium]